MIKICNIKPVQIIKTKEMNEINQYGIITGKSSGSILHWAIRLFIFSVIFYILSYLFGVVPGLVTGNKFERVRWTIQRVFVGVAVDKRDAVASKRRVPQEGTKPRNL